MLTLVITAITLVEIVVLQVGAIILGVTIYFFVQSRKSLRKTIEAQNNAAFPQRIKKEIKEQTSDYNFKEKQLWDLQEQLKEIKQKNVPAAAQEKPFIRKEEPEKEQLTDSLKATIAQQQKLLYGFLKQVEEIENGGKEELLQENNELKNDIERLEGALEKRKSEIEEWKQRTAKAEKMATRIEDVYKEFEQLQIKIGSLEKQANLANNLAIELEDTKQSYEQVYKDVARKQEKLEEVISENQRIRLELETLEDKLAEANLQRQQLQKKVQFLQELNS